MTPFSAKVWSKAILLSNSFLVKESSTLYWDAMTWAVLSVIVPKARKYLIVIRGDLEIIRLQLPMGTVLRMVSDIPESDIFEKIQVLSKRRMCLKSCPPWPPSFPWVSEYSHSILTFKCIPFLNNQGNVQWILARSENKLLWSLKFKLNHV